MSAPVTTRKVDDLSQSSDSDLLSRIRSLIPLIEQEAEATERGNTLSRPMVDALRETELFWMQVPAEAGGGDCDLTTYMRVVEEAGRADGSTGWSLMANASATAVAAAFMDDAGVDRMFGGNEKAVVAGVFAPGGRVAEVAGGYQGSGRYSFGSGCMHSSWLAGGAFIMGEGGPRKHDNGEPIILVCFVPREEVKIYDEWNTVGLNGTGSFDYEFTDKFVGSEFTLIRGSNQPKRGNSSFKMGTISHSCAGHAAMAMGLMARALEELSGLVQAKKRVGYATVIGQDPLFLHGFGVHEAMYQAARDYTYRAFGEAQEAAARGELPNAEQHARMRQATTWVHQVAAEVVRFCHDWGGTDAVRNPGAFARCIRDMQMATQHIMVDPKTITDAAPALVEQWVRAR